MIRKLVFLTVTCLLIPLGLFSQTVTSKNGILSSVRLKDGSYQMENQEIRIVVSPAQGGRIMSCLSKTNLEEMIQNIPVNSALPGGWGYDILEENWPGFALQNYQVKNFGLSKNEDALTLQMEYSIPDPDRKNLVLVKKISIDDFSFSIHIVVEIQNKGNSAVQLLYENEMHFPAKKEPASRLLNMSVNKDVQDLSFYPASGSRGYQIPTDDYFSTFSKDLKNSVAVLFDEDSVQYLEENEEQTDVSVSIINKPVTIEGKKSQVYEYDILILPDNRLVNGGNNKTGFTGNFTAVFKNGKISVDGNLYKYTKDAASNLKLKMDIYDDSGNLVQTARQDSIDAVNPEEWKNFTGVLDIPSKIKSPYCRLSLILQDSDGLTLLAMDRRVKLQEIVAGDSAKNLTLDLVWTLNMPAYPDLDLTRQNNEPVISIYSNLAFVYEKHPLFKSDINLSGVMLYQMAQFDPVLIERYKNLFLKKNLNLLATGFSYPLFSILTNDEISYQIKLDKDLKFLLFNIKPAGIFMPELAFKDGIAEPILKNEITWALFSDLAMDNGYKGMPDIDYYLPSRVISSGFGLNALVADSKAARILQKRTDQSVDEFIQYILDVQAKNKDGKRVLTVALKGDWLGSGDFADKLFTKLEKIKWLKTISGDDIFKSVIPTQTFLGEKISGSWQLDPMTGKGNLAAWQNNDQKNAVLADMKEVSAMLIRNKEKFQTAFEVYPNLDYSYPNNIQEEGRDLLTLAETSDWFKRGQNENLNAAASILTNVRKGTANYFDSLIYIIQGKQFKIPMIRDLGTILKDDEKDKYLNKVPFGKFVITERVLLPASATPISTLSLRFRITDKAVGIDYNNVYLLVNINGDDKYYKIKSRLLFDGTMKGVIGGASAGDEIKYLIYARDRKGNESVSESYSIIVE